MAAPGRCPHRCQSSPLLGGVWNRVRTVVGGSCGLLAVEFIQILFDDKGIDELAGFEGEGQAVLGLELLDNEAEHHFFGVGGVGEELAILGNPFVGLGFDPSFLS